MNENVKEILALLENLDNPNLCEDLKQYHESDIADAFEMLEPSKLDKIYDVLPDELLADIFANLESPEDFIEEMDTDDAADVLEEMETDDAVRILDSLDDEAKEEIISEMEKEAKEDINLVYSYPEDTIGSLMSTDFVSVDKNITVNEAMKTVISKASETENFSVIFVTENDKYYGLVLLPELICARKTDSFAGLIKENYPTLLDNEDLYESKDILLDYELDMVPVLNSSNEIIGTITKDQIMYIQERETVEDYQKFSGVNGSDLEETIFESIKKRIPWLFVLLGLSILVSMLSSSLNVLIAALPAVLVFYQSLVMGMGGNAGTQSLAITIQGINQNEEKRGKIVLRETLSGLINGILVGIVGFVVILLSSLIIGNEIMVVLETSITAAICLFVVVLLSSFNGTIIPIILSKLKIDPAAASGPFITTISDIVSILIYYGLAYLIINIL